MNLRPYQSRAIADLRASYASGKRAPCLVLPTGAGKTVVASEIIRAATTRGNRVLFCAHRRELIGQSVRKLEGAGVTDLRIIQAGEAGNPTAAVTVASVQTITDYGARMPKADLVIFDECHHTVASTWARIADAYQTARLLGLTATPQRADGKPLGDVFDDLIVGATVAELTSLGHLVPCRIWAPPAGALEGKQLALSPVAAYQQHGDRQRAIVFCVTVERAEAVAAEMRAAGIECGVVHGAMSGRAEMLRAFARGELQVIASVHVLTEGFDDPGATVCILERKPQHAGTYLQMVGRVLRPAPGKEHCILIDLTGASLDHGPPEMERAYSLDGKGISKPDRQAIRQCLACGAVFLAGPEACPVCAATMPRRKTKALDIKGVPLVERTGEVVDTLLMNLRAVAKRTRRDDSWVGRAHAAIGGVR